MVGERLLRRLRYRLINHMLRFPTSRFRRTSQGELVSMVTAEVEPLSGIMGDALAHPLFQAGQMLTILTFLFVQNPGSAWRRSPWCRCRRSSRRFCSGASTACTGKESAGCASCPK
ncbi:ABC transporter transmembrane domain-containing protein [Marinobacterium aestuariivivens]|uniref:ABC transporter transmembrane domain-containing protein n=1 Tax=Marinobacterium aestuariivivens TaxID=1698799 RepID=A0ABW1ZZ17_9GAMM